MPGIRFGGLNNEILSSHITIRPPQKTKIVSLQPNISDTPFDQRSPRPPEEGISRRHRQTDRQTDRDYMTESS